MDRLPDELLLKVVRRLRYYEQIRLEAVCIRWRRLLRSLWKTVGKIRLCDYLDNDDAVFLDIRDANRVLLALLQRAGPYLSQLDLSCNYLGCGISLEITERSIGALGKYCPQLTYLDLTCVQLDNQQLFSLAKACQSLKVVVLHQCFNIDEEDRDSGLTALFHANPELEQVHLWGNEYFTGRCIADLPAGLKRLQLSNCVNLARPTNFGKLQCLGLEYFELDKYTYDVTELLTMFGKVREISLAYYDPPIASRFRLIPAVSHWPQLRVLNLSHSTTVSTKLLEALAIHCAELEILKIAGSDNTFSIAALRNLDHLKVLDLMWVQCVNDKDLITVAGKGNFDELHLHYCSQLTAAGIAEVIRLSPLLTFCDVTGCLFLEDVKRFLTDVSGTCRRQKERRQPLTVETVYREKDAKGIRELRHDKFNFIRIGERFDFGA